MVHKITKDNHPSGGLWLPKVDERKAQPLYEQLIEQVAIAIQAGRLKPGDPLPSVRHLAAELRINPNTTARALREMDTLGLSRALRGVGKVVAEGAVDAATGLARKILRRELDSVLRVARELGMGFEAIEEELRQRWENDDAVD